MPYETSTLDEQPDVILEDQAPPQQPDTSVSRQANRFLFVALDLLTPARKRGSKRLRYGGHEVISECLGHTWGFIQKGRFTPLTMGGEPMAQEDVPDGREGEWFPMSQPPKTEIPGQLIMQGSDLPTGAIAAYPGDHLSSIKNGSSSQIDGRPIGLVEIEALRGHNYKIQQLAPGLRVDPDIWQIQRYFFPDFPRVPVSLAEFRALLQHGWDRTQDSVLRSIAEDSMTSCEIGSLWATETLDAKERLIIQSRGHQGYAYVYDELDESLMLQMGREKAEQGMTKMFGMVSEAAQSGKADIAQLAEAIVQASKEGNRELGEAIVRGLQAQQAEKPEAIEADVVEPAKSETKGSKSQAARPVNKNQTNDE